MPNVKFEVFTPGAQAAEDRQRDIARRIAEAYREGHAKGFAQGTEASAREHADAQDQLRAQFIEVLRDSQVTQAVAEREVTASLVPLVTQLVSTLAPSLGRAGLAATLEAQLQDALRTRPDARPVVHCAPELADGVRKALSRFGARYEVQPDAGMTPLEARLTWADGFDEINVDRCLAAMTDIVARFADLNSTGTEEIRSDAG